MTVSVSGDGAAPMREAAHEEPPATGIVDAATALEGSIRPPSDKSIAQRALLFSAMARGEASVELFRPGGDVRSMMAVLRELGAVQDVVERSDGLTTVSVEGGAEERARLPGRGGETLDCGNSGTAMRLLAGALAGRPGRATLSGDDSLSTRPMERIAVPLRRTGATVTTSDGHAPLLVEGADRLAAVHHDLAVASAQVLGCLTLAGLAAVGTTTITVPGPTRDHTERMLAWLGAPVERHGRTTTVEGPVTFQARDQAAPGDISSAAVWLVAGALHHHASVRLQHVGLNPSRLGIVDVLRDMGADIAIHPSPDIGDDPEPVGDIVVRGGRQLRAIEITGDRVATVIDELPLIAVAMAAADGVSQLRDASELRVKESDRIELVVANLKAIGADAEERPDGWRVRRGPARSATIRTAGDHRIAMAFAVAALAGVAGQVHIDDPSCAAVSYPTFWSDMEQLVS